MISGTHVTKELTAISSPAKIGYWKNFKRMA